MLNRSIEICRSKLDMVFGVLGSGKSFDFVNKIRDKVPYFPVFNEASAAIMAGTASVYDKFAAAICIKGPGLSNMMPGVIYNYFENRPMLIVSESFNENDPSYFQHKRMNHFSLTRKFIKGYSSFSSIDQLDDLITLSCKEPPGPIHLDLCWNSVLFKKLEYYPISSHKLIFDKIRISEKPILIIGSLCKRIQGMSSLLTNINIPIFTTVSAKGIIDESLPCSAGVFTANGKINSLERMLNESDLVIGIGLRSNEILSAPSHDNIIFLDELKKGDSTVVLDHETICAIVEETSYKKWGVDAIEDYNLNLYNFNNKWLPHSCFKILNNCCFEYDIVVDVGLFCVIAEYFFKSSPNRKFISSTNSRYMGSSIPSSIASALFSNKPIICVFGDGGLPVYFSEITLVPKYNLPICFLLMSDGSYGTIASEKGISFSGYSAIYEKWIDVFKVLGIESNEAKSNEEFLELINRWDRKSPFFIQCNFNQVDYCEMTKTFR